MNRNVNASVAYLLVLSVLFAPDVRAQEDAKLLCDFSTPPIYAFLGWEKKPCLADGALRIQVPDGKGGCGYVVERDLTALADCTPVLTVVVQPGNKARSLRLAMQDSDGTEYNYIFSLEGAAVGTTSRLVAQEGASLKEPGSLGQPGKQAGFELTRVTGLVLVGDWTDAAVDLSVRRLELVEPTPEILTAREKLRQRLGHELEERKKAEAAQLKRKQELLTGAPHPTDGPEILHVATVAPDVLALRAQEKVFAFSPQVPYEAEDGDVIKREGDPKEKVLVFEDGKVQESLMAVSVYRKGVKLGNLAVNAKRLKPEDRVTGQDLTTETVTEPAAYRISSADDPAWKEPAAPTGVSWKRKPNAPGGRAFEVQVFLKLPKPLTEGKRYRVEFPGVNFRQASMEYLHEPSRARSVAVHVSAIGFRPDDPLKRAFLSEWLGTGGVMHYAKDLKFHVLDDVSGKSVFDGVVQPLKSADEKETFKAGRNYAKTDVFGLDFGGLKTPGRYRVYVEGVGCSYPFTIAEDVWAKAFQLSMRGLLHHRSGIELGPPFTDYARPRNMHPADGVKVFASKATAAEGMCNFKGLMSKRTDQVLPEAWGGHMDAGDWDRNPAHPAAMWTLVELYELFPEQIGKIKLALPEAEAKNAIPDVLDEVLWDLDLYRRLQMPDGAIRGGIESTQHPRPGEASWQESLMLSAYAPDANASFIYAASAAKLARNLVASDKALADTYAASARKAWDWAIAQAPKGDNLAAFEMWRLTGEEKFHDVFNATLILAGAQGDVNTQSKANTSYARLPDGQGDAELREKARKWVIQTADIGLQFADGNAYGITLWVPQLPPMGWIGYFSTPETALGGLLPYAWLLTKDAKYLNGAIRACQFGAGANPDNRAMTTGLGPDPVRYPLHVDTGVLGRLGPAGITVYGGGDPVEDFGDGWAHTWWLPKMVPGSRTWPAYEGCYWDVWGVPAANEYTIQQTIIPTAFYWGFLAARP